MKSFKHNAWAQTCTEWKVSKYGPEMTPYLDSFDAVLFPCVSSLKLIKWGFSVEGKIYEMKTFIYNLYEIKAIIQHDNKHKNIG